VFSRAFEAATEAGAPPLAAVVLAERAIIAGGRDAWAEAAALADRALELIRGGEFDAYWTSALVYAWAARAALYRGDLKAARDHLARAAGLRPLLTHALPVVSVQALLELARAYIALGDPDGAHAVLRQADDIFRPSGSAGSALLRIRVQDQAGNPRYVFGKLYAKSHLRADRSYKLGRAVLYGRLEDEKPFNTVKRLVQQEDYALALMQRAGLPSPEPAPSRSTSRPSSTSRSARSPRRSPAPAGWPCPPSSVS
jgi:tetratricopeptide (TPR) repeat protein